MKKIYLPLLLLLTYMSVAGQCLTPALLTANGNSASGRAPTGNFRSQRVLYLITAAEMATAGFTPSQNFSEIGWTNLTLPVGAVTGNLSIFLENTSDATFLKSTTWTTATSTMTNCRNASTVLPATVGQFSVPFTSNFTYTGGAVYVAFEWTNCGTILAAPGPTISCNTDLVSGLRSITSTTSCTPAATLTGSSSFRPLTSFGSSVSNDAKVSYIYCQGEIALGKSANLPFAASITNNSGIAMTNVPVTLQISGANSYSSTTFIANLPACSTQVISTFPLYTPSNEGVDSIMVFIPADANPLNDTLRVNSTVDKQNMAYRNLGENSVGGVGVNNGTGTLAIKFTTATPGVITHANLSFNTVTIPSQYRIAIYGDNSGVPSTTPLYADVANRTNSSGNVKIKLDAPVSLPAGTFYLALQQMSLDNMALGYSTENPLRSGTFFFSTNPPGTWSDLGGAANSFKVLSGVKFCSPYAPNSLIGPTVGCEGSSLLFIVDTVGVPDATSFTWILPSGYLGNSISDSIYVTAASTPGIVKCVANYPCGSSDTVSLAFTPTPLASTIALSNTGNTASTAGSSSKSGYQNDGQIVYYSDVNCQPIALVVDTMGGNILGNVTATVEVAATVPTFNAQPYCPRTFNISSATQGHAFVQLYVSQADFTAYNTAATAPWLPLPTTGSNSDPNIANVRITKVNGALGVGPATVITPTLNWNSATSYWEIYFPVSSFSNFYIHGANPANQALPVVWQSFDVKKEGATALLSWTTSAEHNNSHFNIQHSTNGRDFEIIGMQKTLALNGNTNDLSNYKFEHLSPAVGYNYYRIEQVDQDNNSSYSFIKELQWNENGNTYVIYPQPATDQINIEVSMTKDVQLKLELTDMSGKIISSQQLAAKKGMAEYSINSSSIQNGIYLLRILENDKISFTQKVSVHHQ